MSKKHKRKKKHTKVFIDGMHVLGGWGGMLLDGYGYDPCEEYDEYLHAIGRTQKTSKKTKTSTKTTKVEVVTPKFEICPAKLLSEKEV